MASFGVYTFQYRCTPPTPKIFSSKYSSTPYQTDVDKLFAEGRDIYSAKEESGRRK